MSELFEFYKMFTDINKKTIVFFKGNFTEEMLHELAKSLKNKMSVLEEKKISRRVFAIFIELAQNIFHYSEDKIEIDENIMGDGIVHIYLEEDNYVVQSGNVISKKDNEHVLKKVEMINSMDTAELKNWKKEIIKKARTREGAGFGLIEVALQSKSKIECKFTEIDDSINFIKIEVKIAKGK